MSDHPAIQSYRRPIGYFEAKTALRKIDKYYELIKIDNFTTLHDQDERKKLQKQYPELFEENGIGVNYQATRKEISKLTVNVYHALVRINAPINWRNEKEDLEYDFEKQKKVEKYNVILDRNYPIFRNKKGFGDIEVTYPMLEESRAVYSGILKNYWKRLVNPLWWIASLLRLPISLLEYMGVNTETESVNKFVYWLLQLLVLIILSFISLKLGLNLQLPVR
jgi:hypothetical protein